MSKGDKLPRKNRRSIYVLISFLFLTVSYNNCAPSFESLSDNTINTLNVPTDPGQGDGNPLGPQDDKVGLDDDTSAFQQRPVMSSGLEKLASSYKCSDVSVADQLLLLKKNTGPLTREQYQNSVNGVFGVQIYDFPIPTLYGKKGYDSTIGIQNPGSELVEAFFSSAQKVIDAIRENASLNTKYFSCSEAVDVCLNKIFTNTGALLFKRPLSVDEVKGIASKAKSFSTDKTEQLEAALYLLLVSPQFTYHSYAADKQTNDENLVSLNEYDLATRLSFFIWGRVPDTQLLNLAKNNSLKSNLRSTVSAMLNDSRSIYLARSLAYNWFNMGNFRYSNSKNYAYSGLRQDQINWTLAEQVTAYVNDLLRNNKPVVELFKSNFQFHTANSAKIYNLDTAGMNQAFTKKTLNNPHTQVGVLTHIGVLSENSSNGEVQIHNRGNFVIDTVLCEKPVGTPSGNLFELGDDSLASIKERVNNLSVQPACAGCHMQMDPYGKALDRFNTLGLYRDKYSTGEDINYSQEIGNRTIASSSDLSDYLYEEKAEQVNYCATKNVLSLAMGKNLFDDGDLGDDNAVGSCLTLDTYSRMFASSEGPVKFQDLILNLIGDSNGVFGKTSKVGK